MSTAQNAGFTGVSETFDTASLESMGSLFSSEFTATTAGNATVSSTSASQTNSESASLTQTNSKSATSTQTSHSAATATSSDFSSADSASLSTGAKAGIGLVIGLLVLGSLVTTAFLIIRRRRRSLRANMKEDDSGKSGKPEHMHDERDACVYHAKPELEDTSTPRNSTGNLLRGELEDTHHTQDGVAELEGSRPRPIAPSDAVEIGPG